MSTLSVCIADVTICVRPLPPHKTQIHEAESAFLVEEQEGDIHLQFHLRELAVGKNWKQIFASSTWKLYTDQDRLLLLTRRGLQGSGERKTLAVVLNKAVTEGEMFMAPPDEGSLIPYPLTYPVHELLLAMYLATRKGLELHACGVIDEAGQANLFVGTSGAGKSTLCNFMKGYKGLTILSDDRVIVRKIGGQWHAYGTPWHGDALTHGNVSAPLGKIFLLEQADRFETEKLPRSEAALLLLADSFPPYWSKDKMNHILLSLDDLATEPPIFRLRFTRDPSVLDRLPFLS